MNIKSDGIFPCSLIFQRSTALPFVGTKGQRSTRTNEFIVLKSAMFSTVSSSQEQENKSVFTAQSFPIRLI